MRLVERESKGKATGGSHPISLFVLFLPMATQTGAPVSYGMAPSLVCVKHGRLVRKIDALVSGPIFWDLSEMGPSQRGAAICWGPLLLKAPREDLMSDSRPLTPLHFETVRTEGGSRDAIHHLDRLFCQGVSHAGSVAQPWASEHREDQRRLTPKMG